MFNPIKLYRRTADEVDRLNGEGFAKLDSAFTVVSLIVAGMLLVRCAMLFGE